MKTANVIFLILSIVVLTLSYNGISAQELYGHVVIRNSHIDFDSNIHYKSTYKSEQYPCNRCIKPTPTYDMRAYPCTGCVLSISTFESDKYPRDGCTHSTHTDDSRENPYTGCFPSTPGIGEYYCDCPCHNHSELNCRGHLSFYKYEMNQCQCICHRVHSCEHDKPYHDCERPSWEYVGK